jgi:zinc transport system substrate-binding protein
MITIIVFNIVPWKIMRLRYGVHPLLAGICSLLTVSCSAPSPPSSVNPQQLTVVATFVPMYEFTKAVAGDKAQVEILIPPGSEVHDHQTKPEDLKKLAQAKLLIKNGLGLDDFADGLISSSGNAELKVVDSSKGVKTLGRAGELVPIVKGKEEGSSNPHIWLDPIRAQQQIGNIRDALIAVDPSHSESYKSNAAAYIGKLQTLDQEYKETLALSNKKEFITFHDAFPYLADRYDLKQLAIIAIPEDELTPEDVQKTVQVAKKYKVKVLLSEPGVDNKLFTTLSKDLNITVKTLDSLENGTLDPDYYFKVMRANLEVLKEALA